MIGDGASVSAAAEWAYLPTNQHMMMTYEYEYVFRTYAVLSFIF